MLVDVGGARGHEVEAIKKKYPNLIGRFLLQDMPDTIEQALPLPGMEACVHDFFSEQPIKGTRPRDGSSKFHANLLTRCTCVLSSQCPS